MPTNLAQKLAGGTTLFGTCVTSHSPHWPEAVAKTGVDFVFIDTEHIPIDRSVLAGLCSVYRALGLNPVVRIPSPDPFLAVMAKDAGAVGVIMPYIETAGQVSELVGATKYRPLKGEKLNALLNGSESADETLLRYLQNYNPGSIAWINIESTPAIENLDQILAVPGLDGVIIGPHDLSVSLGIPEQYHHPLFEATVKEIIHKVRRAGLAAGIHYSGDIAFQQKWLTEGINVVLHASDIFLFTRTLRNDIMQLKRPGTIDSKVGMNDLPVI